MLRLESGMHENQEGGVKMAMERWRQGRGLISRRTPLRELDELRSRFEDFWPLWPSQERFAFEPVEWMPAIDIYESGGKYTVKAELPGMKQEDVDVSVTGDRLTIKGEKKAETEVEEENYYRSERVYGSFCRSIDLPSDADSDKIEANYNEGVLEVSIPKTEEVKSKKIDVSAKQ